MDAARSVRVGSGQGQSPRGLACSDSEAGRLTAVAVGPLRGSIQQSAEDQEFRDRCDGCRALPWLRRLHRCGGWPQGSDREGQIRARHFDGGIDGRNLIGRHELARAHLIVVALTLTGRLGAGLMPSACTSNVVWADGGRSRKLSEHHQSGKETRQKAQCPRVSGFSIPIGHGFHFMLAPLPLLDGSQFNVPEA